MATMLDSYVAEAERAASAGRQGDPAWLTETRRHALERFTALGFPTTREEEWRFTSLAPIAERRFVLAKNGASALRQQGVDCGELRRCARITLLHEHRHRTVRRRGCNTESLQAAAGERSLRPHRCDVRACRQEFDGDVSFDQPRRLARPQRGHRRHG